MYIRPYIYEKLKISPGSYGITVDLYKLFWNNIKDFFVNLINYSFQTGSITELQKQTNHNYKYP